MSCEFCGQDTLSDGICLDCREKAVAIRVAVLRRQKKVKEGLP